MVLRPLDCRRGWLEKGPSWHTTSASTSAPPAPRRSSWTPRARCWPPPPASTPSPPPSPAGASRTPSDWWAATVKAVRRGHRARPRSTAGRSPASACRARCTGWCHRRGRQAPAPGHHLERPAHGRAGRRDRARRPAGTSELIELVGNVAMTSFTLTKLLWVRQHEPRVYDAHRAHAAAQGLRPPAPDGRVRRRRVSDMSGTLMLDQRKRNWSRRDASTCSSIDRAILPPVYESHEVTGRLTRRGGRELGLAAGTPVVGGGGDQPAGAVGNGVVAEGLVSATMGTSGVVFVHSHEYVTDPAGPRADVLLVAWPASTACSAACWRPAGASSGSATCWAQAEVAAGRAEGRSTPTSC